MQSFVTPKRESARIEKLFTAVICVLTVAYIHNPKLLICPVSFLRISYGIDEQKEPSVYKQYIELSASRRFDDEAYLLTIVKDLLVPVDASNKISRRIKCRDELLVEIVQSKRKLDEYEKHRQQYDENDQDVY